MSKKTLTEDEASIVKQMMRVERPFLKVEGTLVPQQPPKKGDKGNPHIDEILLECEEMEKEIAKEIAVEVEGKPKIKHIDDNDDLLASKGDVETMRTAEEVTGMMAASRISHGSHDGVEKKATLTPIKVAQANTNSEAILIASLEACLDRRVVSTGITLPSRNAQEFSEESEEVIPKPPPPPRRFSSSEFQFESTEDWQCSMAKGEDVIVLSTYGDGWTKVRKESGEEGFVPTSFLVVNQKNKVKTNAP